MQENTFINSLRKLAKSGYYQTLYSHFKEGGIKLFKNDFDLTDVQVTFLRYLNFYNSLFLDVALGDVNERIFENTLYEDSYAYWKSKKDNKKENPKTKEDFVNTTHWVLKDSKKK